jgi:tRNA(fMet)-specific endonuclease VapC
MIVDTNALSAAANDDPAVIAILSRADQMAIPAIVVGEYRYGIAQSRHRATYENWLAGLLRDCIVLDINEPTTQHYAEIIFELRRIELRAQGQDNSHQRPVDRSPLSPALASAVES